VRRVAGLLEITGGLLVFWAAASADAPAGPVLLGVALAVLVLGFITYGSGS
jgi:hypothetical protein